MTSIATLVTAGVSGSLGLGIAVLGWITVSAGKGGYGMGPFPFLKVPRDWGLIGIGLALVAVGSILMSFALETMGVLT